MSERTGHNKDSKQASTFRKWYEKNAKSLNAYRRKRYATDPEYREKAKKYARQAREKRKKRGGRVDDGGVVVREVDGKKMTLYRVSAAAEAIGKSPSAISKWHCNGWVPSESDDKQRLYTAQQIKLLGTLAKVLDKYRYSKDYKKVLKACVEYVHENW